MADLTDILARLGRVEQSAQATAVAVGKIEERLSHVPTTAQLWRAVAVGAAAVLAAMLGGGWWAVQQFLSPILEKLGGA